MRGERQAELERLQQLSLEAAAKEEEEATRLRKEEIRYRMELQMSFCRQCKQDAFIDRRYMLSKAYAFNVRYRYVLYESRSPPLY